MPQQRQHTGRLAIALMVCAGTSVLAAVQIANPESVMQRTDSSAEPADDTGTLAKTLTGAIGGDQVAGFDLGWEMEQQRQSASPAVP